MAVSASEHIGLALEETLSTTEELPKGYTVKCCLKTLLFIVLKKLTGKRCWCCHTCYSSQFPAQFDHSKTLSSADEGLVRLTCPPEFQKMCGTVNDHQWRWGLSGSKLNDIGQVIMAGLNCFLFPYKRADVSFQLTADQSLCLFVICMLIQSQTPSV